MALAQRNHKFLGKIRGWSTPEPELTVLAAFPSPPNWGSSMASPSSPRACARCVRLAGSFSIALVVAMAAIVRYGNHHDSWASWTFYSALGEMRETFGVHPARIAAQFRLDSEDPLASSLPAKDEEDSE
jgi:hypothetical protein